VNWVLVQFLPKCLEGPSITFVFLPLLFVGGTVPGCVLLETVAVNVFVIKEVAVVVEDESWRFKAGRQLADCLLMSIECLLHSILVVANVLVHLLLSLQYLFLRQLLVVLEPQPGILAIEVRLPNEILALKLLLPFELPRFLDKPPLLPFSLFDWVSVNEALADSVSLPVVELASVNLSLQVDLSAINY
jgi:hypothetical protein